MILIFTFVLLGFAVGLFYGYSLRQEQRALRALDEAVRKELSAYAVEMSERVPTDDEWLQMCERTRRTP